MVVKAMVGIFLMTKNTGCPVDHDLKAYFQKTVKLKIIFLQNSMIGKLLKTHVNWGLEG